MNPTFCSFFVKKKKNGGLNFYNERDTDTDKLLILLLDMFFEFSSAFFLGQNSKKKRDRRTFEIKEPRKKSKSRIPKVFFRFMSKYRMKL